MAEETRKPQAPVPAPVAAGPAARALTAALTTVFTGLRVVMVIVLVALLFSNTRFLQQNQRAVILRFGKIVGTGAGRVRGPGVVFAWPDPIDEIIIVDAGRIQDIEIDDFMYRKGAREGGTESLGDTLDPSRDGYTLTGDANIIHTTWRVQYQISDVVNFALSVSDPEELIRKSLAAVVVHTSAELTVEEALWGGGQRMRRMAQKRLQSRLDAANSGIQIISLNTPVREHPKVAIVDEAFTRATKASLEVSEITQAANRYEEAVLASVAGDSGSALRDKLIELARAEEAAEGERDDAQIARLRGEVATLMNTAAGSVAAILSEAQTYRTQVVANAASMASTFEALDLKYKENPGVFVRQTYQNEIERILNAAGVKFVLYPREREWRILLEPKKKKKQKEETPVLENTKTEEERRRESVRGF